MNNLKIPTSNNVTVRNKRKPNTDLFLSIPKEINTKTFCQDLQRKIIQQEQDLNKYAKRVQGLVGLNEKLIKFHKKETQELKNHVERRVIALEHSNEIRNQIVIDKRKLTIENKNLKKVIYQLRSEKLDLELINTRLENQIKKLKKSARKLSQGKPTKLIFEDETIQFIGSRKRNLVTRSKKTKISKNKKKKKKIIKKSNQKIKINLVQTKTYSTISSPLVKSQKLAKKKDKANYLKDTNTRKQKKKKAKKTQKLKTRNKKRRISNELPIIEIPKDALLPRRQTLGFANLMKISPSKGHWFKRFKSKKKTHKTMRAAHSACISGNKMYIFGGYLYKNYFNDIYSFSFRTKNWSKINAKGDIPTGRRWNSSVVDSSGNIWIFGGYQSVDRFNDLFCFNTKTHEWTGPVTTENPPTPRYSHTSVIYDNKMWIFGGYNGQIQSNEIFYFNFETNEWSNPLKTYGQKPEERAGHTSVVVGHKMIVFGGYNHKWLNDLYKFESGISRWENVNSCGKKPPGCYGHSAVCHEGCIYFFGGYSNKNEDRQFFNHLYSFRFVSVLIQDMKKLFKSQKLCDLFITSKEGEKIGAHITIVQNRCPVLIKNIDLLNNEKMNVIESIILFLYTDLVECYGFNQTDFISITYLSQMFNLPKLEFEGKNKLKQIINPENIIEILIYSDKFFLGDLKKFCFKYILSHKEIVAQRIDLQKLKSHTNLMLEYIQILSRGMQSNYLDSNISSGSGSGSSSNSTSKINEEEIQPIENYSEDLIPRSTLYKSFAKLYKDDNTKDFTIIVKDRKIHCHKAILIARSELFRGMLTSLKEPINKITEKTGRSYKSIKALIHFFYTEQTDGITPLIALELINASDYYGLNLECQLEDKCTQIVRNNINESNALIIFEKALSLDLEVLKQTTIQFIIQNGRHIINEQYFNESNNVHLFRELTRILLEKNDNSDEQELFK
ncbi:leucine-zipper-like transcriptional regulator 1 [Anaeramoeba flamelloides]|uniref:Leucine-zipper-like transcriptional regulator 1 n=1 Tax=Anaeramoeba flamelloides TaxID=1746091 RepID=A0ABQ8Y845_9EUKA|nr:leucine-zipper-like transcriptional regulator 1 [Anaeramoeba flamelloides]